MPDELTISFQQMIENPEISPPEQIFLDSYVSTLNKSGAWKTAFPNLLVDYGRINALLDKPVIKEQISLRLQKNLDGEIARSPAMLFKYVDAFMNLNVDNYYRPDGMAIPLDEIGEDARLLIMNIERTINNRTGESFVKYTLPNKEKAVDRLLDVVKLLVESRKVVGNEFADEVGEAARMRDSIFNNGDDARPVKEEEPKKADGRGTRAWTEEQREDMRRKAKERWAKKKEASEDSENEK